MPPRFLQHLAAFVVLVGPPLFLLIIWSPS